jgi:O-antigen/teichoic acid export membrane protein
MGQLRTTVVNAALWSAAGEFFARLVPPLVVAYLVRILPAEDFGVVAAVSILIGFCQLFWEYGLARTLVQADADERTAANVVFWTAMGLAVCAYLVLFTSAGLWGKLFSDERVTQVVPIAGLQVILTAATATFTALLQRRLQFRRIFYARLANALAAGAAAIGLVHFGFTYGALIGGLLAGSLGQLIVLVLGTGWRPGLAYDRALAQRLWKFSRWSMLTGLLAWFFVWADSLVVGAYLDTASLGVYSTSMTLVSLTLGLFVAPLLPVLYSALVRLRESPSAMRSALLRANAVIAFLVAPLCAIAIVLAGSLSGTVFGPGWDQIDEVLPAVALASGLSWLAIANNEAYRASGRPELETWIMLVCVVVYLATYLVAVRFGLKVFAWSRCALAGFGLLLHLVFARHFLGLGFSVSAASFGRPAVAAGLTAAAGLFFLNLTGGVGSVAGIVAAALALGLVYFCALFVLAPNFVRVELAGLVAERFQRSA